MTKVIPDESRIPEDLYQKIAAFTPIPCVDLVITRKNKVGKREFLLIKRKIDPEMGKWCLVGGRILGGREVKPETLKGAIERQSKIELGVSVRIIPPWDANHPAVLFDKPDADTVKYPIIAVYPVEILAGEVTTGPESSEVRWFSFVGLPEDIGFTHREELESVAEALKERGS